MLRHGLDSMTFKVSSNQVILWILWILWDAIWEKEERVAVAQEQAVWSPSPSRAKWSHLRRVEPMEWIHLRTACGQEGWSSFQRGLFDAALIAFLDWGGLKGDGCGCKATKTLVFSVVNTLWIKHPLSFVHSLLLQLLWLLWFSLNSDSNV